MTRVQALAIWAAATVPLGILAHFAAEMGALDRSLADLASSPVHAYFGVLGFVSLATVLCGLSSGDVRRRAALLAQALPCRGRGPSFAVVTLLSQLAFVALTIGIEGDPLAAGSIVSAIASALIAAVLGALALHVVRARIESVALRATRVVRMNSPVRPYAYRRVVFGPYFAFVAARGNRPPPSPSHAR